MSENIVKYVTTTPNNTNPVILKQLVEDRDFKNRADWNQNDENAANYIKNRPFFSSGIQKEYVLPEMVIDENTDFGNPQLFLEGLTSDDISSTVFVVEINGKKYTTKIEEWDEGWSYMGAEPGVWTNEDIPFFIDFLLSPVIDEALWGRLRNFNIHSSIALPVNTVSIYKEIEEVKTLDSKFMPEPDLVFELDTFVSRAKLENLKEVPKEKLTKVIEKIKNNEKPKIELRWCKAEDDFIDYGRTEMNVCFGGNSVDAVTNPIVTLIEQFPELLTVVMICFNEEEVYYVNTYSHNRLFTNDSL